MFNSNIFCPLPFRQAVVRTDGSVGPCCHNSSIGDIKKENLSQYWKSEKLVQFKQEIVTSKTQIRGCELCYEQEKLVGTSMRLDALRDHKFINSKYYKKIFEYYNYDSIDFPLDVEMHLGNLCNLKCLTCRPQDSSKFLTENKILKISNENQNDFELSSELILENLELVFSQSKKIDLRGGESLLIPAIKNFLNTVDAAQCKDKILRIQTNGTVIDDGWKAIFKKFKSLEIMLSIDAIEQDIEYIRYPVKWQTILTTLKEFQSIDCKIYINCTISNLNIILLNKLLSWASDNQIYVQLSLVFSPEHYAVENLPQELIDLAKQRLSPWIVQYPFIETLLKTLKSNTTNWKEFCQIIDQRDNYRKNSIFDILPEYKKYWYA